MSDTRPTRSVRAGVVAVGTELLRFRHSDTNTPWLIDQLEARGCESVLWIQVGDDEDDIAAATDAAAERADLVLVCGGIGPTEDDRTRRALARVVGRPLERDEAHTARLRAAFEARGYRFSDNNARQADRPVGAEWIPNPVGSAWGFWLEHRGARVAALPGVPGELQAMFRDQVAARISGEGGSLASRTVRVAGVPESTLDARLHELHREWPGAITVLSGQDGVIVRVRQRGSRREEAEERAARLASQIREVMREDAYAEGEVGLSEAVGRLLSAAGRTLATAESCTGGLLGAMLTDVPGSSGWYRGGWVVYSNELKTELAGVPEALLESEGAVSRPVAIRLADAVRERCRADYGIGITGVAGPDGGTPEKPVGLVHLALARPKGPTLAWWRRFPGDRAGVRHHSARYALDRLRRDLAGFDAGGSDPDRATLTP